MTVLRRPWERPAVAARLSALRLVLTSVRDAFSAGAMAQSTAETSETPNAKSKTFQSKLNGTALVGPIRLAGLSLKDRPVAVEAIDLRTGALPTPIAGVPRREYTQPPPSDMPTKLNCCTRISCCVWVGE